MVKYLSSGTTSLDLNTAENSALDALCNLDSIKQILSALETSELFIVGGSLRRILNNQEATDLDLSTKLTPEVVTKKLTSRNLKVIPTGIKHGTVTTLIDEKPIEITTFRKPNLANKPLFSDTIEEDLSGRDFTINALALRISDKTLLDPYNGLSDLKENILKTVGDPSIRFSEDPLRILRMIRFGTAEGREIDSATLSAATKNIEKITSVSVERIQSELTKILLSDNAGESLKTLNKVGGLKLIFPEAMSSIGFEQNEFHIHDVWEHTLWVLDRTPKDLILRLAALFHDLGKPHTFSVGDDGRRHFYEHEVISEKLCIEALERLKYSNKIIDDVRKIVRLHMRPMDCGPSGVRRLMRDLGDLFQTWRKFKYADCPPVLGEDDFDARASRFDQMVLDELYRIEMTGKKKLAISGHDIMKLGVTSGPSLGKILKQLEEIILDDPTKNDLETLISLTKQILSGKN